VSRLATENGILDVPNYLHSHQRDESDELVRGARTFGKYLNASKEAVVRNKEKYKLLHPFMARVDQNIRDLNKRLDNFVSIFEKFRSNTASTFTGQRFTSCFFIYSGSRDQWSVH